MGVREITTERRENKGSIGVVACRSLRREAHHVFRGGKPGKREFRGCLAVGL